MTTFKAPFQVYAETSAAGDANAARARTTAAVFNAPTSSGDTATVFMSAQGKVDVSGALKASSTVSAGATYVSGALRASGIVSSDAGSLLVVQSSTVTEGMTAATQLYSLPNCDIEDVMFKSIIGFGTAASQIDILIGTSGDDDHFGRFTNVSSQPALSLIANGTNVCGINMHNHATQGFFVKTTAVSGAVSSNLGVGLITTHYRRRT